MWLLVLVFSTVIATGTTVAIGWKCLESLTSEGSGALLPEWLESVAPLKGRWLRVMLAAPALAVFLAATFVLVFALAGLAIFMLLLLFSLLTGIR